MFIVVGRGGEPLTKVSAALGDDPFAQGVAIHRVSLPVLSYMFHPVPGACLPVFTPFATGVAVRRYTTVDMKQYSEPLEVRAWHEAWCSLWQGAWYEV